MFLIEIIACYQHFLFVLISNNETEKQIRFSEIVAKPNI